MSRTQDNDPSPTISRNPVLDYVLKHWRGELPLAVSFWINFILLIFLLRSSEWLLRKAHLIEQPQYYARASVIYLIIVLGIIAPWQLVGLWRTCKRHKAQTGNSFWSRAFRGFAILMLLLFVAGICGNLPVYRDMYRLGFMHDKYSDYTLELKKNDTLIYLKGGIGYGISKDVEKLLKKHPEVRGIVLDSPGGEAYEGQQLSKLINSQGLNTYSFNGCASAATTAFIGGNKRYLGDGASMGFHQPRPGYQNLAKYTDIKKTQEQDILIFKHQGVAQSFLDKMFDAPGNDMWYPAIDELLNAGVIHGVVDPCDILEAGLPASVDINDEIIIDDITSDTNKPAVSSPEPKIKTEPNIAELKTAAEAGDANSQSELADRYALGQGVKQDYNETVRWLRKAAEQGNVRAQNSLGYCYDGGHGITQDYNEAVRWYRKAAEQGYANAQCRLANCYYWGDGVSQDYKEALKWYFKAAEQGYARAQYSLGLRYDKGQGIPKNYKKAVKWYKKAAEQGISRAQYNLGLCYATGRGVEGSGKEAVNWFRKAAEQGNVRAQNSLGISYTQGYGVPIDYAEAYKWFLIAESKDTSLSKNKDFIAARMTQEQITKAKEQAKEFLSNHK